jgi:hypothetical protein
MLKVNALAYCHVTVSWTVPQHNAPVSGRRDYAVVGPQHRLHFILFLVKIVVFEQFMDFEQLVSGIWKSQKFVYKSSETRIFSHRLHRTLQLREAASEGKKLFIALVEKFCSTGGILLSFGKNLVQRQEM